MIEQALGFDYDGKWIAPWIDDVATVELVYLGMDFARTPKMRRPLHWQESRLLVGVFCCEDQVYSLGCAVCQPTDGHLSQSCFSLRKERLKASLVGRFADRVKEMYVSW